MLLRGEEPLLVTAIDRRHGPIRFTHETTCHPAIGPRKWGYQIYGLTQTSGTTYQRALTIIDKDQ